jgi:threonine-phosphate decarboxylase
VTHKIMVPVHGGQLPQIAARYGFSAEQLLDFSANINPAGPPSSVLNALQKSLADHASLVTYPDLELTELKRVLASHMEVASENICVANGFVPLLESALRSLKIERCLLPVPCFSEYRRTLENARVSVFPYLLLPKSSFRYQLDSIVQALLDHSCDAILLANPQNPSGALFEAEFMYHLIEIVKRHNITVLLDEAFIDYSPSQSLAQKSSEVPNLIVFRSVTKFYAIPGLRVAYAISNALTAKTLGLSLAPWPISTLASAGVCAALIDDVYCDKSRITNHQQRTWLEQELSRLSIFTYPSSTNFLLLRFPPDVEVGPLWERMIEDEQIVLRSCENFEGLAPGHVRIAVRSEPENNRLIGGLERVLARIKR